MNKKEKIYLVGLLWVIVALQMFVNQTAKKEDEIVEAFSISNSVPINSTIDAYGLFGKMYLSEETKENMLVNLAKELGITEGYTIENTSIQGYEKSVLKKEGKYGNTTIQIVSSGIGDEINVTDQEQYILIGVELFNDINSIGQIKENINTIYKNIGVEDTTNICLKGSINGELSGREKINMINKLFKAMNAKEITSATMDNTYNVYGYTKNEENYVYQMGEKVNVNIAITYDSEEDITYIHMASPFINKSF